MSLRGLIFGHDVQCDRREVARRAYNYVFAEAGLDWYWSRGQFTSLFKTSSGVDAVKAYVESQHPDWRWNSDLALLVRAAERRHVSILRDLLDNGACRDLAVADFIAAMLDEGLGVAALSQCPDTANAWMVPGVLVARDHQRALDLLGLSAGEVVCIECDDDAIDLTQSKGLAAIRCDDCDFTASPHDVLARVTKLHDHEVARLRPLPAGAFVKAALEVERCLLPIS